VINPKLRRILQRALRELEKGNPHEAVEALGQAMDECEEASITERQRILKAKDEADIGNPDRAETLIGMILAVKGFKPSRCIDNRRVCNGDRAARADKAMAAHRGNKERDEADLCDLLADLMHMAHRDSVDFQKELNRATRNFNAER
jgi:hypothetical protein